MKFDKNNDKKYWFVMRDLKRSNAKTPAYKLLEKLKMDYFVPMKWKMIEHNGSKTRKKIPVIQDLLFVHEKKEKLDLIVKKTPTLQYRYMRGAGYCCPMVVDVAEMTRFITAVKASDSPVYYLPGEVDAQYVGSKVRIMGGPMDGFEGILQDVSGTRKKRFLVELSNLLIVSVEVNVDYFEVL